MSTHYTPYSLPLPLPLPKSPHSHSHHAHPNPYNYTTPYSISPPEDPDSDLYSTTTSSGPTYSNPSTYHSHSQRSIATAAVSSASSHMRNPSVANSTDSCEYDSAASASGVDFQEYIHERVSAALDPLPVDRAMARQAQTSGQLNDKHRQLLDLQAAATARLARSRKRYAEGLRDAREVQRDLQWTHEQVNVLKMKAERKYGKEYAMVKARYPLPGDDE